MLPIPQSNYDDPETLASWIELCALSEYDGFVPRGNILESFRDSQLFEDSFPRDGIESDKVRSSVTLLGDVWRALVRRRSLLGTSWPLALEDHRIRRRLGRESHQAVAAYSTMLLIEAAGSQWYSDLSITAGDRVRSWFEEIVVAALPRLVGGRAHRFGVPFSDEWPRTFPSRVQHLAGLFDLQAREVEVSEHASIMQQDDSLDIVARCRIADEDESSPYLLIQCATGSNWIADKKGEPAMKLWGKYINWNGPQFKALAVPFSLRRRGQLFDASLRHEDAIILDRIRISRGYPDRMISDELRKNLVNWCESKFACIRPEKTMKKGGALSAPVQPPKKPPKRSKRT